MDVAPQHSAGPIPSRGELLWAEGFILLACAGLLAMVVRVAHIQANMAPTLAGKAVTQQRMVVPLPARRGYITDSAGRILAGSVQAKSVFVDPQMVDRELPEVATLLADTLHLNRQDTLDKLLARQEKRFVWIKRRVEPDEAQALATLDLPGVGVIGEPLRHYPMGDIAAHVVGYCGAEDAGLEGLERHFDTQLRGEAGFREMLSDVRRRPLQSLPEANVPPRDGYSLILTIDSVIQASAQRHLRETIKKFQAKSGVAIVMDPRTGEVLALANEPTFDPNQFSTAKPDQRRNRALTDPYEPGSIFKSVVAASALDLKYTTLEEMINCEGGAWRVGKRLLHDSHPHNVLSVRDIVVKSSNIGMAKLGYRMGNAVMYDELAKFGFAERTGIDLPGEDAGLLPPLRKWTSYSTASIAMGHEAACTPIQMLNAFCAILNDGQLLRPRVVRGVFDAGGNVIDDRSTPITVRQVLRPELAKRFTEEVMAAVVRDGTGKKAAVPGFQVVGKTGTAQIPKFGSRGYDPGAYVASFLGATPASDPQVAVIVSVVRPKPSIGYYGGTVAAPCVGAILQDAVTYLAIPPELPLEEKKPK